MSENSFSLIVALPGEEPIAHELQGDAITFGRSPENQIQVLVAEVSVRHGQLVREGDGYRIVDPGSTNGTRVNGQPIGPEGVVLNPMDRLLLGTLVPAYFVPSSMLVANAPAKLIATIEASAAPARVKTAPVSIASPAAGPGVRAGVPFGAAAPAAPVPAAPGGPATVKLDQLRAPGPGVRPAPVPTAPRLPAAPAAVAPAAAPAPLRPPGVAPVTPVAPVAPVAPANAPAGPGAPAPVRPAAPLAAAIPVKPAAGVIPVNSVSGASTVPIKRVAPSAPTIPLPKKPGE
jgi:hypothetical protein